MHGAAAQVLAGAEPEKTNAFLLMLAQAATTAVRSRGSASPPGRYTNPAPAGAVLPEDHHLGPKAATQPARRSSPSPIGHALMRGSSGLEGGPASFGGPPSEVGAARRWSPEADLDVHGGFGLPGWSNAESRPPPYARVGAHPAAGGPRMQPQALPPLPTRSARPGSGLDVRAGQAPAGELHARASHPAATWSGEEKYTEHGRVADTRRVRAAAGELRLQSSEDGALRDQGDGLGGLMSGAAPGGAHATGAAGGGEAFEDLDDLAAACALVAAVTEARRFPVSSSSRRSSTA